MAANNIRIIEIAENILFLFIEYVELKRAR